MPKIRDSAITIEAATVTSSPLEMPVHETGDLLIIFFNKDTPSGGPSTPSGWSTLYVRTNPMNSAGAGNYFFAKRATSSSEAVTLTYTSETSITAVLSVKNCFGSTVNDAIIHVSNAAADDSTLPYTGGTLTTTNNNTLVIGFLGTDSGFGPYALPGFVNKFAVDTGANSLSLGYTFKKTPGLVTHPGYWGAAADDTRWMMLGIRDDGNNTEVDPYVNLNTEATTLVAPLVAANTVDRGLWITNTMGNLNGKTVTNVIVAAAADSGYNPFHAAARHVAPSSKTGLGISQLRLTANQNMNYGAGVLFGTYRPQLPRDYIDTGKVAFGGILVRLGDAVLAANADSTWIVGAQFSSTTDASNRQNFAIQPAQTSNTKWSANGSMNTSVVDKVQFGGSGYYGAASMEWSKLYVVNCTTILGGTSTVPLNLADVTYATNQGSGEIPLIQSAGSAVTVWTRLQFGGVDETHIDIDLSTFQYPKQADGSDYLDFHVDNNVLGIEFYGLANDSLVFTSSTFTSQSPYYWKFNPDHFANCTTNFAGSTVVRGTITLQNSVTLNNMSFISCPTFYQNNAIISQSSFNDTTVIANNISNISDSTFTMGTTNSHAIEARTTGTFNLTDVIFVGYAGSDGSVGNESFYNNSGGAITLNVTGGTTPSVRNGASASTTVVATVSITLTGMKDDSEVRIYSAGTTTEIDGIENATDGTTDNRSFTFSVTPGEDIDIRVFNLNWISDDITTFTVPSNNAEIPIAQRIDRVYANI
jgi:hypothetical protein